MDDTSLRFAHVSFGDGQPRGIVSHIVQDNQGFLWFGTPDGLKRYDGYRVREYRHDPKNSNSLSGVYIFALSKDQSGNLWVGSDQFLDRYDPVAGVFTHYASEQSIGPVYDINQDRAGAMWFATEHGLTRLDPATSQITHYRHRPNDPASLSSDLVKSTFEQKDGTFWVATTNGLDVFNRQTGQVTQHLPLTREPEPGKLSLFEDHAGVVWVIFASGNGLAVVERTANKLTYYSFNGASSDNTPTTGVEAIQEDEGGTLWLGTSSSGILKLDRDRKRFVRYRNNPRDPDSLSADRVNAIFEDREGTIWACTQGGGVNRFAKRPLPFTLYRHEPGNPNSLDGVFTQAVYEDSRGILWVATERALNRIDRKTGRFTFYRYNPYVISIVEDRSGYLWLGTYGGGLKRFDQRTGQVKVYRHDPANPRSLSSDTVPSVLIDRKGALWAGTMEGLNAFDPRTERFQVYRASDGSPSRYHAIAEDSKGALWLTGWGVHQLDPTTGRVTIYHHAEADGTLSIGRVWAILVDRSGTIWAGTEYGLDRFDAATGTFRTYEREGLPNSTVTGILEDSGGDLWLSTNNGVSRFDPRTKTLKSYYASDGILADGSSGYAPSKSQTGEMFFPGPGGLTAFFPAEVVDNPYVPPVVLTEFQLFGVPISIGGGSPLQQSISVTNAITLSHQQNIFSFEFSALSYASPQRNRYRYRLEGLGTAWNETDSGHRFVTYTTLSPGQYLFHVQGRTSRGNWNESGASVHIRILPPWWGTWWFRGAGAVLILLSLWSAHHFRLRQIARQFNLRLEERVRERTRIARELHDTLLQSFQGLMLRFQTVDDLLPGHPGEAKQELERALDRADQAIIEGRDAVQDLRASTVVVNDLAESLMTLGDSLASPAAFQVTVEGAPRNLHPILRDEVHRIALEALRNAFGHAGARRIDVEITYNERLLRLRIRDDGKGIDPEILNLGGRPGHWGLPGMRERAERIGAKLDIQSRPGAGTEVDLNVPGPIAYGTSPTRATSSFFRKKTGTSS